MIIKAIAFLTGLVLVVLVSVILWGLFTSEEVWALLDTSSCSATVIIFLLLLIVGFGWILWSSGVDVA